MQQIRTDPITGRRVLIASDRAKQPYEFQRVAPPRKKLICPFCEGHEESTPPEVLAYRDPQSRANDVGWQVRVVPNKYPALEYTEGPVASYKNIYETRPSLGVHEIVIESPRHVVSISEYPADQLGTVLWAYRQRLEYWSQKPQLASGVVFKNAGALAGASLEHAHSQLMVLPLVPNVIQEELAGAGKFFEHRQACVFCDMIERELTAGERIVADMPSLLAFCPFASRFPYEIWVLPKSHASHFERSTRETLNQLAPLLQQLIRNLEAVLDRPAYNYLVHTAPFGLLELDHYHWHIEIFPRVTKIGGFEWSTGYSINSVPPEDAAASLRNAIV